LNAPATSEGEGAGELEETISQHEQDARRLRHPRRPEELAQLRADVAGVLSKLTGKEREVALLLQSKSVAEAARTLGVPRTTLYESVRRLRALFEHAGLDKYLQP